MKVAVIGLGQFGKSLALQLAKAGAEVIAIDSNMDLVDDVKNDVALAVKMDATDERDLRSQGVAKVNVVVASIGDFEANQLVTVLAKRLGVPRVLARASGETHARILKLIGADEVILPEVEAASKLTQRLLLPSLRNYFELIEGYSVAELEVPESFHGKTLAELDLRRKHGVNLIALKRKGPDRGTVDPVPAPTEVLRAGDVIAVAGADAALAKMLDLAKQA